MKNIKPTFLRIWLFFLIFVPVFKFMGFKINSSYFFVLIPAGIGFFYFYYKKEKNGFINNLLFVLFISSFILSIRQALILFKDMAIMKDLFIGFMIFFSCYYIVNQYNKFYGNSFHFRILSDLYYIGVFHSLIVFVTFIFPSIKPILYDFIWVTPKSAKYLIGEASGYRFSGIVQSGFSFLSTTHSLFFILGILRFNLLSKLGKNRLINHLCSQSIIFISIILIGRTGLVTLILFLFIYYTANFSKYLSKLIISKNILKTIAIISSVSIIITLNVDFSQFEKQLKFAFELAFYYFESGNFQSLSMQILKQEYFLPDSLNVILFGSGGYQFGIGSYSVPSDVGWVRFIFGGGIFGIIVAFSVYVFSGFYAFKNFKIFPQLALFIIVYVLLLLLLNFKDYYYFAMGSSQIFFISLFTFIIYVQFIKQKYAAI